VLVAVRASLFDPRTLVGSAVWGAIVLAVSLAVARAVRRFARRVEPHFSDVTGLRFVSALAQVFVYLIGFILYAHLVPELRVLGGALLTGVSVASVVVGLAAQNTLGNLVSGLSLVLYRPFRVGDRVELASAKGPIAATIDAISLGYTILRDEQNREVIVPNSVMASSLITRLGPAKSPPRADGA
jgi:small-conductance mechanosensitive channel